MWGWKKKELEECKQEEEVKEENDSLLFITSVYFYQAPITGYVVEEEEAEKEVEDKEEEAEKDEEDGIRRRMRKI